MDYSDLKNLQIIIQISRECEIVSIVRFKEDSLKECEIVFNDYIRTRHIQKENIMNITVNEQNDIYEFIVVMWK